MVKPSLAIIFCGFLLGCDHLALQNEAIRGARKPAGPSTLMLSQDLRLEFRRGVLGDRFTALLGRGEYKAVIETDSGTFYIAPKGTFSYKNNGKVKSPIGGIFARRDGGKALVWLAAAEGPNSGQEDWESGKNIEDMLPGVLFFEDRPWIEKDFEIPEDAVIISKGAAL